MGIFFFRDKVSRILDMSLGPVVSEPVMAAGIARLGQVASVLQEMQVLTALGPVDPTNCLVGEITVLPSRGNTRKCVTHQIPTQIS